MNINHQVASATPSFSKVFSAQNGHSSPQPEQELRQQKNDTTKPFFTNFRPCDRFVANAEKCKMIDDKGNLNEKFTIPSVAFVCAFEDFMDTPMQFVGEYFFNLEISPRDLFEELNESLSEIDKQTYIQSIELIHNRMITPFIDAFLEQFWKANQSHFVNSGIFTFDELFNPKLIETLKQSYLSIENPSIETTLGPNALPGTIETRINEMLIKSLTKRVDWKIRAKGAVTHLKEQRPDKYKEYETFKRERALALELPPKNEWAKFKEGTNEYSRYMAYKLSKREFLIRNLVGVFAKSPEGPWTPSVHTVCDELSTSASFKTSEDEICTFKWIQKSRSTSPKIRVPLLNAVKDPSIPITPITQEGCKRLIADLGKIHLPNSNPTNVSWMELFVDAMNGIHPLDGSIETQYLDKRLEQTSKDPIVDLSSEIAHYLQSVNYGYSSDMQAALALMLCASQSLQDRFPAKGEELFNRVFKKLDFKNPQNTLIKKILKDLQAKKITFSGLISVLQIGTFIQANHFIDEPRSLKAIIINNGGRPGCVIDLGDGINLSLPFNLNRALRTLSQLLEKKANLQNYLDYLQLLIPENLRTKGCCSTLASIKEHLNIKELRSLIKITLNIPSPLFAFVGVHLDLCNQVLSQANEEERNSNRKALLKAISQAELTCSADKREQFLSTLMSHYGYKSVSNEKNANARHLLNLVQMNTIDSLTGAKELWEEIIKKEKILIDKKHIYLQSILSQMIKTNVSLAINWTHQYPDSFQFLPLSSWLFPITRAIKTLELPAEKMIRHSHLASAIVKWIGLFNKNSKPLSNQNNSNGLVELISELYGIREHGAAESFFDFCLTHGWIEKDDGLNIYKARVRAEDIREAISILKLASFSSKVAAERNSLILSLALKQSQADAAYTEEEPIEKEFIEFLTTESNNLKGKAPEANSENEQSLNWIIRKLNAYGKSIAASKYLSFFSGQIQNKSLPSQTTVFELLASNQLNEAYNLWQKHFAQNTNPALENLRTQLIDRVGVASIEDRLIKIQKLAVGFIPTRTLPSLFQSAVRFIEHSHFLEAVSVVELILRSKKSSARQVNQLVNLLLKALCKGTMNDHDRAELAKILNHKENISLGTPAKVLSHLKDLHKKKKLNHLDSQTFSRITKSLLILSWPSSTWKSLQNIVYSIKYQWSLTPSSEQFQFFTFLRNHKQLDQFHILLLKTLKQHSRRGEYTEMIEGLVPLCLSRVPAKKASLPYAKLETIYSPVPAPLSAFFEPFASEVLVHLSGQKKFADSIRFLECFSITDAQKLFFTFITGDNEKINFEAACNLLSALVEAKGSAKLKEGLSSIFIDTHKANKINPAFYTESMCNAVKCLQNVDSNKLLTYFLEGFIIKNDSALANRHEGIESRLFMEINYSTIRYCLNRLEFSNRNKMEKFFKSLSCMRSQLLRDKETFGLWLKHDSDVIDQIFKKVTALTYFETLELLISHISTIQNARKENVISEELERSSIRSLIPYLNEGNSKASLIIAELPNQAFKVSDEHIDIFTRFLELISHLKTDSTGDDIKISVYPGIYLEWGVVPLLVKCAKKQSEQIFWDILTHLLSQFKVPLTPANVLTAQNAVRHFYNRLKEETTLPAAASALAFLSSPYATKLPQEKVYAEHCKEIITRGITLANTPDCKVTTFFVLACLLRLPYLINDKSLKEKTYNGLQKMLIKYSLNKETSTQENVHRILSLMYAEKDDSDVKNLIDHYLFEILYSIYGNLAPDNADKDQQNPVMEQIAEKLLSFLVNFYLLPDQRGVSNVLQKFAAFFISINQENKIVEIQDGLEPCTTNAEFILQAQLELMRKKTLPETMETRWISLTDEEKMTVIKGALAELYEPENSFFSNVTLQRAWGIITKASNLDTISISSLPVICLAYIRALEGLPIDQQIACIITNHAERRQLFLNLPCKTKREGTQSQNVCRNYLNVIYDIITICSDEEYKKSVYSPPQAVLLNLYEIILELLFEIRENLNTEECPQMAPHPEFLSAVEKFIPLIDQFPSERQIDIRKKTLELLLRKLDFQLNKMCITKKLILIQLIQGSKDTQALCSILDDLLEKFEGGSIPEQTQILIERETTRQKLWQTFQIKTAEDYTKIQDLRRRFLNVCLQILISETLISEAPLKNISKEDFFKIAKIGFDYLSELQENLKNEVHSDKLYDKILSSVSTFILMIEEYPKKEQLAQKQKWIDLLSLNVGFSLLPSQENTRLQFIKLLMGDKETRQFCTFTGSFLKDQRHKPLQNCIDTLIHTENERKAVWDLLQPHTIEDFTHRQTIRREYLQTISEIYEVKVSIEKENIIQLIEVAFRIISEMQSDLKNEFFPNQGPYNKFLKSIQGLLFMIETFPPEKQAELRKNIKNLTSIPVGFEPMPSQKRVSDLIVRSLEQNKSAEEIKYHIQEELTEIIRTSFTKLTPAEKERLRQHPIVLS